MITTSNLYAVVKAMAPLYVTIILGFISVRYMQAFSQEQCSGINHFVASYAAPFLVFRLIAANNPYAMSLRLLASDTLQKIILLVVLFAWAGWRNHKQKKAVKFSSSSPLQWVVTIFSLATLPNTVIMGVPLLGGMYGSMSAGLLVQILVPQFCIWFNLVIFLYEYLEAKRGLLKVHHILSENSLGEDQNDGRAESTVVPYQDGEPTIDGTDEIVRDQDVAVEIILEENEMISTVPNVSVKEVLVVVLKKILGVPNTCASIFGLLWSLIAFKVGIKLPAIVDDSLAIVSTTAVGLSMFSAGTFLARQTKLIPCGFSKAILSLVVRFIVGPLVMAATSLAMGLRGTVLHIAIVQAALPLAMSSFVYAEEYKLHADIMTTGIVIGNFISLPFTLLYYILTGL